MRQFAEAEIVIPSGPYQGGRLRIARNPFAGLWYDAVDSGVWRRFAHTGAQQGGKTLNGSVVPLMYHLFELGETVIFGVPTLDMVRDKWMQDIFPAIVASRYREFLPRGGEGSRGGNVESLVDFTHGPSLKFMTGGGGDKARAGFTSRVLVVTEADGMDESGGASREADKISQLEGRTRAFGDRARTYLECTTSTEEGCIWREYTQGTQSRIAIRCPHCVVYVTPEREHLKGWQDANDVREAAAKAAVSCPECGAAWTEEDRRHANADAMLVHRGQRVENDKVVGDAPLTDTLGFRWTATNNLLVSASVAAQEEWRASRDLNEENAERKMRQWWWALPSAKSEIDLTALRAELIIKRTTQDEVRRVPTGTKRLTLAVDLGKWLCHWAVVAWKEGATPHVVEYGRLDVDSKSMDEQLAILQALRTFRDDVVAKGWEGDDGIMHPAVKFVDSGKWTEVAYAFCEESGPTWLPAKGLGASQDTDGRTYREVKQTGSIVVSIGDGYHVVRLPGRRTFLVEVNADYWKEWAQQRLQTPMGQPGAMTLHRVANAVEHLSFAKHMTAEVRIQEFIAGKGLVTKWKAVNRNNHFLDVIYNACAAAAGMGEKLVQAVAEVKPVAAAVEPDAVSIGSYLSR